MNTVNSQQIANTQALATTNVVTPKRVEVKAATSTVPAKNLPELDTKGQESAVVGNPVPESVPNREAKEGELDKAIARINNYVQQIQRDLQFSVDDESGKTVIKVIDSESKEVIRQIPEEVLLQIAQSIEESLEGALLEVEA
jgi:flagellar protein FlaG